MGEIEVIRLVTWIAAALCSWAALSATIELNRVNGAYVLVRLLITIAGTSTIGAMLLAISRQWFTSSELNYGTWRFSLLLVSTVFLALEPIFIRAAITEIRKQHNRDVRRQRHLEEEY